MSRQKSARVEYPLWSRCAACLLLIAPFPCAVLGAALGAGMPHGTTIASALVSLTSLRVLTGYKKRSELLALLSRYLR